MKNSPRNSSDIITVDLRGRLSPKLLAWEVFLFGGITSQLVAPIIQHMLVLDTTNEARALNLVINSPGGEVSAGMALIDVMRGLRHPVQTTVLGQAASMAALIAIAGEPGMRIIGTRSQMLFHPVSDGVIDYAPYIHDHMTMLKQTELDVRTLMEKCTKLPKALIDKAANGELWLDTTMALKYGVMDIALTDRETALKAQNQGKKR